MGLSDPVVTLSEFYSPRDKMGKCLCEAVESLVLIALLGRSWEQGRVAANPMSTDGRAYTSVSGDGPEQTRGPKESNEDGESATPEEMWEQKIPVPQSTTPPPVLPNLGPARSFEPACDLQPLACWLFPCLRNQVGPTWSPRGSLYRPLESIKHG